MLIVNSDGGNGARNFPPQIIKYVLKGKTNEKINNNFAVIRFVAKP